MKLPDEITTARIKATRIKESDLADICDMDKNSKLQGASGGGWTEEKSQAYLKENLAHWDKNGFGIWMLKTAANGAFIGRAGLRRVEVEGKEETELAFGFKQQAWGWGMATEIAKELVLLAFKEIKPKSLVGLPSESNLAYRRVMEKLGFQLDGKAAYKGEPIHLMRLSEVKEVKDFERVLPVDAGESAKTAKANAQMGDELGGLLQEEEDLPELK